MKQLLRWIRNVRSDPSIGFSVLRVCVGLGFLVRGASLMSEPRALTASLAASSHWGVPIAAAHLCGGILLALGLGTRIAAGLQVPALLGTVLLVSFGEGALKAAHWLEFSILGLCMLVVYSVFGGGKLSLDAVLEQRADAEPDSEADPAPQAEPSRLHLS